MLRVEQETKEEIKVKKAATTVARTSNPTNSIVAVSVGKRDPNNGNMFRFRSEYADIKQQKLHNERKQKFIAHISLTTSGKLKGKAIPITDRGGP
jgi:hypothetical protein